MLASQPPSPASEAADRKEDGQEQSKAGQEPGAGLLVGQDRLTGRRPGHPQLPPQVPSTWQQGAVTSSLNSFPNKGGQLKQAEGSSASWGPTLAALLADPLTWDKLFRPQPPEQVLPWGIVGRNQGTGLRSRAQDFQGRGWEWGLL